MALYTVVLCIMSIILGWHLHYFCSLFEVRRH